MKYTLLALLLCHCVGDDAPSDPYDLGKSGSGAVSGKASAGMGTAGMGTAGMGTAGMGTAGMGTAGMSAAGIDAAGMDAAGTGAMTMAAAAGSKLSHYPIVVGSRWTYHHVNPSKQPWDESDSVEATTYMGKDAVVLTDQEDAQGLQTRSTLVVDGTGVYRAYREVSASGQVALKVSYSPGFLRYDEAWTKVGQTMTLDDAWMQTCVISSSASKCAPGAVKTGTSKHVFEVMALDAEVTVPAGSFKTVQIKRTNPDANEVKLFWFAAGVGKVREEDTSSGAVEELTAYDIP